MGQKAHPYGLRLGYIKPWRARWFARKNYGEYLHEDLKLRDYLKEKLAFAGISNIEIERSRGRVRVRIFTARPGVIIGRRGQEIDKIKEELSGLTRDELFVDIKEVKSPQTDAQLIADNVALQLEKRIGFRRAMKKTLQMAMSKGALGIKIKCKGRLGGSEIARQEKYHQGKVPLSTFRADVDYGFSTAFTTYGTIGVKVWIYKGDIYVKKAEMERKKELEQMQQLEPEEKAASGKGSKKSKSRQPKKEQSPEEDSKVAVDVRSAQEEKGPSSEETIQEVEREENTDKGTDENPSSSS